MPDRNHVRLLHGPYRAPALRRGDSATCLFRDGDVIVIVWSDARIPWLRCRRVGMRGGYGLLVDEELARAVRCESTAIELGLRPPPRRDQENAQIDALIRVRYSRQAPVSKDRDAALR